MNPGRLVDVITISYPYSSSKDSYGQVITHYTTGSHWAEVQKVNGGESYTQGSQFSKATYDFIIRNETSNTSASYDENATIAYENKTYNVVTWDYVPRSNKRYIKLTGERQP